MVNRKGLKALGYDSPEEIIGKTLRIEHEAVGYIPQGVVCGVTNDFNYTSMREESIPMIIMQRPLFLHNIMVRLHPAQPRALETFNNVWKEIFPDYPARYAFIGDVYGQIFRNELNAGKLVRIFSLLCLLIANLGLIIYMAFIIKLRTKEIGIRKALGAQESTILGLFVTEAAATSALGGVLGIGLGYLLSAVANRILPMVLTDMTLTVSPSIGSVAVAFSISVGIGVLFGFLPARRAARLNPIEALRYD